MGQKSGINYSAVYSLHWLTNMHLSSQFQSIVFIIYLLEVYSNFIVTIYPYFPISVQRMWNETLVMLQCSVGAYTTSFCPIDRICLKQRAQKIDFCTLSLIPSLKDGTPCRDSGGCDSKRKSIIPQNFPSWSSYLRKKQINPTFWMRSMFEWDQ